MINLNWSEIFEPNENCRYDHCFLETPIGKFQIEWKSWKKYDSYSIYLDNEYINQELNLEGAKQFCLFFLERKLNVH